MTDEYSEEDNKFAAYADYYTVIPQIQMNYYSMLNLFELYSMKRMKKKVDDNLKIRIQVRIQKLYNMFREYKSQQEAIGFINCSEWKDSNVPIHCTIHLSILGLGIL